LKHKDESTHLVKGLHNPLISETLFYEVQDILEGKKRQIKTTIASNEMMPLRGFLNCSKCTRTLTSSASKGRNAYYYYYHCSSSCGYRTKADIVNDLFVSELKEYVLNDVSALHFKTAILDSFESLTKHDRINKSKYIVEITELNKRITQGRELLLSGDIDGPDYKIIKSDAEQKIAVLESSFLKYRLTLLKFMSWKIF
jgi:site-specific DNA recombinase